ncbi:hypothetical protein Tco_0639056 [Tanacetum coccineum]
MLSRIAKFQSFDETLEAFDKLELKLSLGNPFGTEEFNLLLRAFCTQRPYKLVAQTVDDWCCDKADAMRFLFSGPGSANRPASEKNGTEPLVEVHNARRLEYAVVYALVVAP